jgi:hypothetical protein
MKRRLSTPDIENMTDTASIFSFGVLRTGAPARVAMSASPVASMTRLALGDDAADRVMLHDRCDAQPMQQGRDAGLLDQHIGNPLEHLGIECVGERLRLRHCRAHGLGACLEFDADALAIHRMLVSIPGEPLHAHLRDVAAEAAIPIDQCRARTGSGRGERRRKTTGSAADDQYIGFQNHLEHAGGFGDRLHGGLVCAGIASMAAWRRGEDRWVIVILVRDRPAGKPATLPISVCECANIHQ